MSTSESLKDVPDWVQADEACLRMWRSNKAWRRSARAALPPSSGAQEGTTTLGDTLFSAAQWWCSRERKEAQEQGAVVGVAHPQPLAPHSRRCLCKGCEKRREDLVARAETRREKRRRSYRVAHVHPEYREDWRISPQRLADFLKMHEELRDSRGRLTHCDFRARWIAHLDGLLLHQALTILKREKEEWALLITKLAFERVPRAELCEEWGMSAPTLSRRLNSALRYLRDIVTGAGREQSSVVSRQSAEEVERAG